MGYLPNEPNPPFSPRQFISPRCPGQTQAFRTARLTKFRVAGLASFFRNRTPQNVAWVFLLAFLQNHKKGTLTQKKTNLGGGGGKTINQKTCWKRIHGSLLGNMLRTFVLIVVQWWTSNRFFCFLHFCSPSSVHQVLSTAHRSLRLAWLQRRETARQGEPRARAVRGPAACFMKQGSLYFLVFAVLNITFLAHER